MNDNFEKLKNLKQRAEQLSYSSHKEQDDILRKTKMYVELLFPNNYNYIIELGQIKFTPNYVTNRTSDEAFVKSWQKGVNELVNFLDTRIEEYTVKAKSTSTTLNEKVYEKVYVQDTQKIKVLQDELTTLKTSKRIWSRIDYTLLTTIFIASVGSSFALGFHFGNNRFDKEKIQLYNENQSLKHQVESLKALKTNIIHRK